MSLRTDPKPAADRPLSERLLREGPRHIVCNPSDELAVKVARPRYTTYSTNSAVKPGELVLLWGERLRVLDRTFQVNPGVPHTFFYLTLETGRPLTGRYRTREAAEAQAEKFRKRFPCGVFVCTGQGQE